jgi:hypothetical protein
MFGTKNEECENLRAKMADLENIIRDLEEKNIRFVDLLN